MKKVLSVLLGAVLSISISAQVKTPAPSPSQIVKQDLGLTKIIVNYSRPSVKKRTIFGELVPYDKMWRTGANSPTTVEFKSKVKVEGNKIKKGEYALFTIPGKEKWTIILNKNLENNVWNYDTATEVARFEVTPVKLNDKVETFTIGFNKMRDAKCNMEIRWEKTMVPIKIAVNTDKAVMATIEETMAGPGWYDKYRAARYYYENEKDVAQALTWINEASKEQPDKYWVEKWRAEIMAANGQTKEAIEVAKKSKELSAKADNQDYVKMNEDNIAKWSSK